jgi:ParB/RepB/Spo0J family partition protein
MANSLEQVPLSKLRESPTNPRKLFGDLTELADSLRIQGVLQPLVARIVDGELELVFGHRRFRAAKLAGLKTVPVIVRVMTDVEVLEAQLTENLARADVHPLELAEGYERLMKVGGLTGDQVAERLGISRSSVFTVLKLRDLVPEARKAFLAGRIASEASAVAIARVKGEKPQLAALKAVEDAQKSAGGALPVRAVQKLVQRRFMPETSRAEQRRRSTPTSPAVAEREVQTRTHALLLTRVGDAVQRKTALDDAEVRLLLSALSESPAVAARLQLNGVRGLGNVTGARLRALLVDAVLAQWLETDGAAKVVARIYGLSLAEVEKTARALVEADGLFKE